MISMKKQLFLLSILAAGLTMNANAAPVVAGIADQDDERFNFQCGASVVYGGVEADTSTDKGEWHEFLVSVPEKLKLSEGRTYKISYDYIVKKADGNTEFYHVFRTGGDTGKDLGWERWTAKVGEKGHKEFTVLIKSPGYRFLIGILHGGAIRIENLKLEDVSPAPDISTVKGN